MKINICKKCNLYTLKEKCSKCGKNTYTAHPARFSIEKEKKYGKYRRIGKDL